MASCVERLEDGIDSVRRWRAGVIIAEEGDLRAVKRRWFGKRKSYLGVHLAGRLEHAWFPGDVCRLFYHQPFSTPDFLTLSYVVSGRDCRFATFRRAVRVLDEIAELKGTWAIVCHLSNRRISDRLLQRWGWTEHCLNMRGRHYIKRFSNGNVPSMGV